MIPSEVVIDGVAWTVEKNTGLTDFGESRGDECKILLRADMNYQVQEMTFWHELIHAIFQTRDLKLTPNSTPDELEEQVASLLGPALWCFTKANLGKMEWQYE
jgi:hypothetical protein